MQCVRPGLEIHLRTWSGEGEPLRIELDPVPLDANLLMNRYGEEIH